MRLSWIHLRYFPPGLILEYAEENGRTREKLIDLLDLDPQSNLGDVAEAIIKQAGEILLSRKHKNLIIECLEKLRLKSKPDYTRKFHMYRMLRTHAMPITDACLSKDGTKCLTTSFDRTCKIWDMNEGRELLSLADHIDIVCCVSINPLSNLVLTGSYDGTVRLWRVDLDESLESECLHILRGSDMSEVQTAQFSPDYLLAAAGSSDATATVYDLTSGIAMYTFEGHEAEISSVGFDQNCQTLLTGSFDSQIGLWDLRSGNRIAHLKGHEAEVVSCLFNFSCDKIASGSMDTTVRLWDIRNDKSLFVLYGHCEDISDVQFDYRGKLLASASKDGQLLLCDVPTCTTRFNINAHETGGINKICFSPNGSLLLSAGDDSTAKVWNPETGNCSQILEGHSGKVITASFSYMSDSILTVATDNTSRLWK